jgi:HlyD family secretion protein
MWTRKRIIYVLLAVALVSAVVILTLNGRGVTASTAIIKESSLSVHIRGEGQSRLVDSYLITSPVSGQLERFDSKVGTLVEKGTVLFRVLPMPDSEQAAIISRTNQRSAAARVNQAQVMVDDARAVSEQLNATLKRHRALFEDGVVAKAELESSILAASSAEKGLEAALEDHKAASASLVASEAMAVNGEKDRIQLGTVVVAPTDGKILRLFERNELVISAGSPIMEIGNTRLLELVIDVLSEDAVQIVPGNAVAITGWGGEPLSGVVRTVEPAAFTKISALGVEEQRVNVVVDFDSIPSQLGVGYRVEAAITVLEASNLIVVPITAVFQEEGVWFAYAVVSNVVEKRLIELGIRSADFIEVKTGLVSGDEVVLYPSADIKDGVTIKE